MQLIENYFSRSIISILKKIVISIVFPFVILFSALVIISGCDSPVENNDPIINPPSALDSKITSLMQQYNVPGVAACAIKNGEIIWKGSFGFADVNTKRRITDTTLFMIGSISKTVTGVAFMQLYERGLIDLDDNINDYLPFVVSHPDFPDSVITPRMLLSHVSGLRDNWNILNNLHHNGGDSPIQLEYFIQQYLVPNGTYYNQSNFTNSAPGATYEYTNVGATLIAYLVSAISGNSFEEYCQINIFSPLGMNESSWFLSNLNLEHVAVPHVDNNGTLEIIQQYGSPIYPCGFLRTSTTQLSRFLLAIMNGGTIDNFQLLNISTVDKMLTLHYPSISPNYGLFWEFDYDLWGHRGGGPGVGTIMGFSKQNSLGFIVFTNIENAAAQSIAQEIMNEFN
jgi:CubicO group peptidase (beta-lactamase class C family)